MSSIDALPADQKAVLQLLLRQDRTYAELSGLLKLESEAVRRRAHEALHALGPADAAPNAERRAALSDWLLDQQSAEEAARTSAALAGSDGDRAWARTVADQLRPLGGQRIPQVPEASTGATAPVAATAASGPAATAVWPAAARGGLAGAGTRVSRRGGAFLIGGAIAVAAVIGALVLLLGGGDDKQAAKATSTPATTATTGAQPAVKAQINLTPPTGGSGSKRAGILWILDANGQAAFTAAAQGLPTTKGSAYGIWLYNGQSDAKLVGGFDQFDKQGRILASGGLSADPTKYKQVVVTREKGGKPKQPGRIVLQGAVASATAPATGTGTATTP